MKLKDKILLALILIFFVVTIFNHFYSVLYSAALIIYAYRDRARDLLERLLKKIFK
jgi:hypothetical protein